MQLTPRTLGIALGACLAGGLVLGVASSVGTVISARPTAPDASGTMRSSSATDLGDREVSYPPTEAQSGVISAAPESSPAEMPETPVTSIPSSSSGAAAPAPTSPTPTGSRSPAPRAATTASPPAIHPANKPRPTSPSRALGNRMTNATTPRPRAQHAVTRTNPQPLDGWRAPSLGIGVTNIGAPRLSSGLRAAVTVMCTPSSACDGAGSSLTITPDASSVSVTWSAPEHGTWRPWSVTRAYRAPRAG